MFFPQLNRKAEALFIPYEDVTGEVVNFKARCVGEKAFTSKSGGKTILWNLPAVVTQPEIYITEGEIDALSLIEAGIPADQVTSVPGAETAGKAILDALDKGMKDATKFILCGDSDEAGLSAREVLVRELGAARCWFVDWPQGVKDANQFLTDKGPEALASYVRDTAKPYPVDGLYTMDDFPEPPPIMPWNCGFPEWENKLRFAPGTMGVITGHPGHGKSHLMLQVFSQISKAYGVKVAAALMETTPKRHGRRQLRSFHSGRLEKDMDAQRTAEADAWIQDHWMFMHHPEFKPEIRWMLDRAEVAVVRHGCRVVMIDPWNKLESHAGAEINTQYIGAALEECYNFSKQLNCCFVIVAHPSKMGARIGQCPQLEDIAGSKFWDTKVDFGISIHADEGMYSKATNERTFDRTVYVHKTRYEELGYPGRLKMRLNPQTGCYVSTDYETIKGMAG